MFKDLLNDPEIDAVYIPLPNGLHFEWTKRSLLAGKHVLLEKPAVSNAAEAKALVAFYESIPVTNRPVILEAYHYKFHPAWQEFLSILETENDQANIEYTFSSLSAPKYLFSSDDIRFNFKLAGGASMDMGCYMVSILRQVFGADPVKCTKATPRFGPAGSDPECEQAMKASWKFPNGGIGEMDIDLARRVEAVPIVPYSPIPFCTVKFKKQAADEAADKAAGTITSMQRTVTFSGTLMASHWHSIDVIDSFEKTNTSGSVLKKWTKKSSRKAYGWGALQKEGTTRVGEGWWSTYRHQLEQFVNRVKGRQGSGIWVELDETVKLMEMVDGVYEKAGLPIRPTSTYQ